MEYIANEINPPIKKKYGVKHMPIKRNKRRKKITWRGKWETQARYAFGTASGERWPSTSWAVKLQVVGDIEGGR
jgi:hypothetical protein